MGWIPCSGNSGTKKKIEKMEVQDSLVGQIKATPGTDFLLLLFFLVQYSRQKKKGGHQLASGSETLLGTIELSLNEGVFWGLCDMSCTNLSIASFGVYVFGTPD